MTPMMSVLARGALALLAAAAAAACQATAVAGPDGSAAQGRRSVVAQPTGGASAPATIDLQSALIESVDLGQRRIVLNGRAAALDPAVRVLRAGRPGSLPESLLRAGQPVRFALKAAASSTAAPVVSVIFLEVQP